MGLFGWLRKAAAGTDGEAARRWREAWMNAVAALDAGAVARLEAALRATPPFADDLEIEEEMLDGLRQLLELERGRGGQSLAAARAVSPAKAIIGRERVRVEA